MWGAIHSAEIGDMLINIYDASRIARKLAINNLKTKYDFILTDAMKLSGFDVDIIDIIKGDAKALPIAAASIIAKVTRDHLMEELGRKYTNYGFEIHKGYGTKMHLEALEKYGPIEGIHRFSYRPVKNYKHKQLDLFESI